MKRFKSLFDRLTNTYPTATKPRHVLPIKKGRKTTEAIVRSDWIFTRAAVASERAPVQTGSGHASCVISERRDIPLWCNTAIYWPRETTATTTRASSRLFQVIITLVRLDAMLNLTIILEKTFLQVNNRYVVVKQQCNPSFNVSSSASFSFLSTMRTN